MDRGETQTASVELQCFEGGRRIVRLQNEWGVGGDEDSDRSGGAKKAYTGEQTEHEFFAIRRVGMVIDPQPQVAPRPHPPRRVIVDHRGQYRQIVVTLHDATMFRTVPGDHGGGRHRVGESGYDPCASAGWRIAAPGSVSGFEVE